MSACGVRCNAPQARCSALPGRPARLSLCSLASSRRAFSSLWPAQTQRQARQRRSRAAARPRAVPETTSAAWGAAGAAASAPGAAAAVAAALQQPPMTFEPRVDGGALAAQLLVLAVTLGAAGYWWLALVPSARRTLAREKRAGALGQYLRELQDDPRRGLERWFYTDWLRQLERRQQLAARAAAKRAGIAEDDGSAGGALADAEEASAAEGDAEPAFMSLDNPIIATAALLGVAAGGSALLRALH